MKSLWSHTEAEAAVVRYARQGYERELSLRVYTTRLLGGDPRLVLHGGGNTSVKMKAKDVTGEELDVLCVKGSGWDMAKIEPPGLPAVRLASLQKLLALDALSDEDMVNVQRLNLLDSTAPNPSVETLFHAFLPHRYIDHTHANAVLALTDQPNGEQLAQEVYGDKASVLPYTMAGFILAKKAGEAYLKNTKAHGLVLAKHGIFSFGESAQEAYERMIALVSLAEERLAKNRKQVFAPRTLPAALATPEEVAPMLRGLAALPENPNDGVFKRFVVDFRTSPAILNYVNGAEIDRYSQIGVATPDHVIRTKSLPVVLPAPELGKLDEFNRAARTAFDAYQQRYHDYFARNNARQHNKKVELDRNPRVCLVPGLGVFALGKSHAEAKVAADLAECNIDVITDAEAIGTFNCAAEADLFDIEYWSLEQAKLGKGGEKPLARHVAVVTGGGSGIGAATAAALAKEGADVAVLDRDPAAAEAVANKLGGFAVACDVTKPDEVRAAFDAVCRKFGGVDILVSNAGAAWQGRIGDVADKVLRESFELNFFSHQSVAQNAVRVMRNQGTGGCLLFNVSKQAVNPGPDFGPYGLPKAALMFLVRQYALDHGAEGIRANGINADRIRTGLLTDAMVATRSKARGMSEKDYMSGNLLKREVYAADVAKSFVDLALATKTTGAILTVDGGNIAAVLR
ncbi:MAG: bifunctional aldolase/short-chain dehydrogenase [Alphaproteobacteria bacterium]